MAKKETLCCKPNLEKLSESGYLEPSEQELLFKIAQFLVEEENFLGEERDGGIFVPTDETMARTVGMKYGRYIRAMKKLAEKGAVKQGFYEGASVWLMNPNLFWNGNRRKIGNEELKAVFEGELLAANLAFYFENGF